MSDGARPSSDDDGGEDAELVEAPASADAALDDEVPPSRLHPSYVAIATAQALAQLLVPLTVGALGAGGPGLGSLAVAFGGVVVATVLGGLRWRAVRYRVTGGALRVRTGLISPDDRVVPVARIAALDVQRGLLQRLFGVVALHVRTAGGGRAAEVRLDALDPAVVERLRTVLEPRERASAAVATDDPTQRSDASRAPAAAAAPAATFVLGRRRLLVAAATSPAIGVVGSALAVLAGVLSQGGGDGEDGFALARRIYDWVDPGHLGAGLVAEVVIAFVAATWLVAFVLELARLAGFHLIRDGVRLRIAHGLVPERRATVPLERIRAVRVVEGILRQPFGLAEVRLEIAGYAKDSASTQLLLPLVDRKELTTLMRAVVPELPVPDGSPPRPPARALRRALVRRIVPALVPAGALVGFGPGALPALGPVLVARAGLHGWASWRAAGAELHGNVLRLRRRRLARTTLVADAARLQRVDLAATPLQRRARLRSFAVRVASARSFRVADVDEAAASRLLDELRARAPDVAAARARGRVTIPA